jgi:hypothetical protein
MLSLSTPGRSKAAPFICLEITGLAHSEALSARRSAQSNTAYSRDFVRLEGPIFS